MAEQKVTTETYIKALKQTNFNKKAMSRLLGVQRCTIYYWTEKLVNQGIIDIDGNILKED